uniref:Reverse transcriptase zinc-binding domain-containing protein n=1 Tax=Oryza rufipogon TaxID=4529 RepID=A0A0E0QWL3_ORYRU
MLDCCRVVEQHAESIHHILASCSESRQLWWLILSAIWPVIVHPFGKPFLLCLGGVKAERGSARLITRERNNMVFNNVLARNCQPTAEEATLWHSTGIVV